ncbi:MAG: hypothetical protein OXJ53_16745 [Gammaproteobacteria bacterium]|nr:hypothetical protein [Gammaproteobacteria bacterium]MDE0272878.1 hypothetical protein [Gammaproteobacteria bacterium]
MNMKLAVAFACGVALLGLASPSAFADADSADADVDSLNSACQQAWADSEASATCQATSDGEPRHVRIETYTHTTHHICWLKVDCTWIHPAVYGNQTSTREYEGRRSHVRKLRNCHGILLAKACDT